MKVIKCQAWEEEFEKRINVIRDKELALYRKYAVAQALSGAIYSALPLLTGTVTFIAYIALGNTLDVATALTSLALFEILRCASSSTIYPPLYNIYPTALTSLALLELLRCASTSSLPLLSTLPSSLISTPLPLQVPPVHAPERH